MRANQTELKARAAADGGAAAAKLAERDAQIQDLLEQVPCAATLACIQSSKDPDDCVLALRSARAWHFIASLHHFWLHFAWTARQSRLASVCLLARCGTS